MSGQAGCSAQDNPPPAGTSCKAGAVFSTGTTAVHWACINPFDEEGAHIDIYGAEDVPSGTICWSVRR